MATGSEGSRDHKRAEERKGGRRWRWRWAMGDGRWKTEEAGVTGDAAGRGKGEVVVVWWW